MQCSEPKTHIRRTLFLGTFVVSLHYSRSGAHQQVLVDLQIAIIVCQIGGSVQRCEALVVALVDLCTHVEEEMDLQCMQAHLFASQRCLKPQTDIIKLQTALWSTISICLYVVAKWMGAPAPLSCVMK